jgi:AraC family transcriptional regulator of adaptative response/methylated-DNA-[protein]-cysteine methyltransferase
MRAAWRRLNLENVTEFNRKNRSSEPVLLRYRDSMKANISASEKRVVRAPRFANDTERWNAVRLRDRTADGAFFYSVKTTGVYCRPSCGARLARRENVAFHSSCAEAEQAGFRPCKRCHPNGASPETRLSAKVAEACRLIENSDVPLALGALAQSAGLSSYHFHRLFKKVTGLTPRAYAAAHRAERLRARLPRSRSVTDAIYDAGFNSNSRFYETASKILGMQPNDFRRGGKGATIQFAVGECSLGSVLVAASAKGICAIFLGDDPNALIQDLHRRFPHANLQSGDRAFETLVSQVVGLVEAPQLGAELPLDIRGTAFQQRVWNALREIPAGTTASYTDIARRVGMAKAVRAVAQACGANPVAIAIPCHRVVRSDGSLSGYRWGVERKRALLKREASASTIPPLRKTSR